MLRQWFSSLVNRAVVFVLTVVVLVAVIVGAVIHLADQNRLVPGGTSTAEVMFWVVLAVILLLGPLVFLVFRRLMAPMRDLAEQIADRHLGLRLAPVRVGGGREIRRVADTFNQILDERNEVLDSLAEREAFFRSLSRSAPIGIIQTDVLGRIEFVNPAFEQIMGSDPRSLINSYLIQGVYEEDRPGAIREWRAALASGKVFRGQFRVRHRPDNELRWVDVMTAPIETDDKSIGTITVVRDITHELEVESQLRDEQQRADVILGVLQEGVLMVDNRGIIRYANRAACTFLGAGVRWQQGNFFALVELAAEGEPLAREELLGRGDIDSLYAELRNGRGQQFAVELTLVRLHRGEANERLVVVLRDDSERRRQEQRLSWEATHDSLTGLLNRRAFSAALVKWLGEAPNLVTASVLMLIDLDHFKPVNDEGGHLLGDDLLRRLGHLFSAAVRQSDTVARIGGDEFGIILPACGLERAAALAEKLRAEVEALTIESGGRVFGVTTSIGLTELSAADASPREAMARADEGCYAAKARGRNTVVTVPVPPEQ